eukprot:CAMPEP_0181314898 /NCGR_PEP_ID=MMETSP1101-20121128/15071_1 /TAXON_ID=46948 /ORGANISM="Rhodomonas abbreviata, Strain Caron Lab Isolate" /LENGTH=126 /DNA_ID=CAMNT_0023422037 /DNA_START=282 /DNA_END=660 /DNA_ORIENTATION=+
MRGGGVKEASAPFRAASRSSTTSYAPRTAVEEGGTEGEKHDDRPASLMEHGARGDVGLGTTATKRGEGDGEEDPAPRELATNRQEGHVGDGVRRHEAYSVWEEDTTGERREGDGGVTQDGRGSFFP